MQWKVVANVKMARLQGNSSQTSPWPILYHSKENSLYRLSCYWSSTPDASASGFNIQVNLAFTDEEGISIPSNAGPLTVTTVSFAAGGPSYSQGSAILSAAENTDITYNLTPFNGPFPTDADYMIWFVLEKLTNEC